MGLYDQKIIHRTFSTSSKLRLRCINQKNLKHVETHCSEFMILSNRKER